MGWHWFVCLLAALKLIQVERSFAEKHYSDLSTKPFFGALVEYIISGPVVAMVWQGKGVVATGRKIIGATNPAQAEPGTIRGDFCIEVSRWGFFSARLSVPEFQNSKLSPSNCDKGQVLIQKYFHTWFVFFCAGLVQECHSWQWCSGECSKGNCSLVPWWCHWMAQQCAPLDLWELGLIESAIFFLPLLKPAVGSESIGFMYGLTVAWPCGFWMFSTVFTSSWVLDYIGHVFHKNRFWCLGDIG